MSDGTQSLSEELAADFDAIDTTQQPEWQMKAYSELAARGFVQAAEKVVALAIETDPEDFSSLETAGRFQASWHMEFDVAQAAGRLAAGGMLDIAMKLVGALEHPEAKSTGYQNIGDSGYDIGYVRALDITGLRSSQTLSQHQSNIRDALIDAGNTVLLEALKHKLITFEEEIVFGSDTSFFGQYLVSAALKSGETRMASEYAAGINSACARSDTYLRIAEHAATVETVTEALKAIEEAYGSRPPENTALRLGKLLFAHDELRALLIDCYAIDKSNIAS